MNTTVSILICYRERGRRKTAAAAYSGNSKLKPGIGKDKKGREFPCPDGVYYIRWYQGKKQVWKAVGTDPNDALIAQMNQEATLSGERKPVEQSALSVRPTLTEATEAFLSERSTQTNERGVSRWRWELELFAKVCGKVWLDEVNRADI